MAQKRSTEKTRFIVTDKKPTNLDGYPQRILLWEAVKRLNGATYPELFQEMQKVGLKRPLNALMDEKYCRIELVDMTRREFLRRED